MDDNYYKGLNGSGDNFGDEYLKQRNSSGSNSSKEIRKAVEECVSSSSSTLDVSRKNIKHLTEEIYKLPGIKHFHLERNAISMIPEDLFQKLPHLVWLDLRFNKITALPPGIGHHRQLKTLLLERNPIKELPTELGSLTSLTALNLRHCPLEFPPKDVIQKGLKSILCFLRASGNDRLLSIEPATSVEKPPVEKLNFSELLQSSLDVSDDWPNEEEKLRFQKLKEEIIKVEKEEFLTDHCLSAIPDCTEAQKNHGTNKELNSESASLGRRMSRQRNKLVELLSCDRAIQAKRDEKCRSAAGKELKEQALFKQRKNNKEMLQDSRSSAMLMKEKKETFRFSPTNADTYVPENSKMPQTASYATDNIGYYAMKEGPEKQKDHTPEKMEQRLLKAKDETTRFLREKKMEQCLKWHTQMVKAREKLRGTRPEEKQDLEMVEELQTELAKIKRGLPLWEHRFTAFTGEFLPDSPGMQTKNIFSKRKF